ncbi:MAG: beta-glucosidase [Sedimentisphaerales bacterium]|nr:beta-glucosidase [Sedimentisphaerales bacterium]
MSKLLVLSVLSFAAISLQASGKVEGLQARGHDSRIDLRWEPIQATDIRGYDIYRAGSREGLFTKINSQVHRQTIYSDFIGNNDQRYYYRVKIMYQDCQRWHPGGIVTAATQAMSEEELLSSVQEATLRYFWEYGHPVSGLARERLGSKDTCTSGGSGFGMMAIMVGVERGFIERADAAARLLRTVRFLQDKAQRYYGVWSHWLNGRTGETIPFSRYDDGGDLVETSFLMQGMLTVRQYFQGENAVETELRRRITQLWKEVEWDWYLREKDGKKLYWHWSEQHGWKMNHAIGGHFNECMITYLLAIASPTHPIPADCYYKGWCGEPPKGYVNGKEFYGYRQWVGWPKGGPLFFTHYSYLGFDPRNKRDKYCNYFENNRNISLINRAYCEENPGKHKGYSELCWGLTSSDTPGGYTAHEPRRDNGTITPTAAICAMPYIPKESIETLKHFYHEYGDRLWGEFGFKDAFNLDKNWFASSYLAIDQGPIVCMIENYRSGLCWKMFMANPEIPKMLQAIGWKIDKD